MARLSLLYFGLTLTFLSVIYIFSSVNEDIMADLRPRLLKNL